MIYEDELGYYSDENNCKNDILIARSMFGDKNTTREQYEQMEKTLGIMYCHCPDSITNSVHSMILEAERRKKYFIGHVW